VTAASFAVTDQYNAHPFRWAQRVACKQTIAPEITQARRNKKVSSPLACHCVLILGRCRSFGSDLKALFLLSAVATFPAIAFLVVVHGAVLAGLFAIRLVPRK
jgi:hypothetical protein